jgi:hypothetical protein
MDFEYVRDDQRGDGSACVTGHKVLCRARTLRALRRRS